MKKIDFSEIEYEIFQKPNSCNDGMDLFKSSCNCSKGKYQRACKRSTEQAARFLSRQTWCWWGDVNIMLHTSPEDQKYIRTDSDMYNNFYYPYIVSYMKSLILDTPVKFSHLIEHENWSFEGKFIKDYAATVMPQIINERE